MILAIIYVNGWLLWEGVEEALSKSCSEMPTYEFLDRRIPFVDAVFRSVDDPAALDEAARLLYEAEVRHGVGLFRAPGCFLNDCSYSDDGWKDNPLQPFLAETHVLLTGQGQQFLDLCDANGCDRLMSFSEWGHEMARWAESTLGLGGQSYIEFAWYNPAGANYAPWSAALDSVLDRKSSIYDWSFNPERSDYHAADLRKDHYWHGLVDVLRNQARPVPPSGTERALACVSRLGDLLRDHAVSRQAGRWYPRGTHFVLTSDPDTVLWSCGAFISSMHRKPPKSRVGWIEAVPDLVIECRSPSDINRRLDTKIGWWLGAGVKCVWALDVEHVLVEIHEPGCEPAILRRGDVLSCGELVPGFAVPITDLLAAGR